MNDIEHLLFEQMESNKFHEALHDDFSFVDSLIDKRDLDRINEGGEPDACND